MAQKPSKSFTGWLQQQLGGFGASVSGKDDAATHAAIADFQKAFGLKQTGTATAETVQALRNFKPAKIKASATMGAGASATPLAGKLTAAPIGQTVPRPNFSQNFDPNLDGTLGTEASNPKLAVVLGALGSGVPPTGIGSDANMPMTSSPMTPDEFGQQFDPNMQGTLGTEGTNPALSDALRRGALGQPPPQSYPTGNSMISPELGTGALQISDPAPKQQTQSEQDKLIQEWMLLLFAKRPPAQKAPPPLPLPQASGIAI